MHTRIQCASKHETIRKKLVPLIVLNILGVYHGQMKSKWPVLPIFDGHQLVVQDKSTWYIGKIASYTPFVSSMPRRSGGVRKQNIKSVKIRYKIILYLICCTNVSSHFKYPKNQFCIFHRTWKPIRMVLTEYAWTNSPLEWLSSKIPLSELVYNIPITMIEPAEPSHHLIYFI